jgi:hypothetical protein
MPMNKTSRRFDPQNTKCDSGLKGVPRDQAPGNSHGGSVQPSSPPNCRPPLSNRTDAGPAIGGEGEAGWGGAPVLVGSGWLVFSFRPGYLANSIIRLPSRRLSGWLVRGELLAEREKRGGRRVRRRRRRELKMGDESLLEENVEGVLGIYGNRSCTYVCTMYMLSMVLEITLLCVSLFI